MKPLKSNIQNKSKVQKNISKSISKNFEKNIVNNVGKSTIKNNKADEKNRFFKILEILNAAWPDAKCELLFNNDFQLLLAVVLSAQTTDKAVNKALKPLLEKHPDFSAQHLLNMGEAGFYQIIKSIGLAPTKSKNSYNLSAMLMDKFGGNVPKTREELESLPGVGRKTANVVLNVLCRLPTFAVDTHVERLTKRMGFVSPASNRLQVEESILDILPQKFALEAHHLLIFHGRYHCVARKPKCITCPIEKLCPKIGV